MWLCILHQRKEGLVESNKVHVKCKNMPSNNITSMNNITCNQTWIRILERKWQRKYIQMARKSPIAKSKWITNESGAKHISTNTCNVRGWIFWLFKMVSHCQMQSWMFMLSNYTKHCLQRYTSLKQLQQ